MRPRPNPPPAAPDRMTILKSALFTILVPGTVVVVVPRAILSGANGHRSPSLGLLIGGAVVFLAGLALYLICLAGFVRHGHGTPSPTDPPRRLVVRGPYRYSRNPMYLAVLSMVFGEAACFGSLPLGLYAAILTLAFHVFVIRYEEPTLARLYGADYKAYRRSVPRWFGRRPPRRRPDGE